MTWQESLRESLDSSPAGMVELQEAQVVAVASESDPMGVYYVLSFEAGTACTCPGFRYRETCKHVTKSRDAGLTGKREV